MTSSTCLKAGDSGPRGQGFLFRWRLPAPVTRLGSYTASAGRDRQPPQAYKLAPWHMSPPRRGASRKDSARTAGRSAVQMAPPSFAGDAPTSTPFAHQPARHASARSGQPAVKRYAMAAARSWAIRSSRTATLALRERAAIIGIAANCDGRPGGGLACACDARARLHTQATTAGITGCPTASESTAWPAVSTTPCGRSWRRRTSAAITRGSNWSRASTAAWITAFPAAGAVTRWTLRTASGATGRSTPSKTISLRASLWSDAERLYHASASSGLLRRRVEAVPVRPLHHPRHGSHTTSHSCEGRERRFLTCLKAGVSTPQL